MSARILAVAERADFGPAYEGENFITLTFRVPKNTPAYVGKFDLIPRGPGTFWWALSNEEKAARQKIADYHGDCDGDGECA